MNKKRYNFENVYVNTEFFRKHCFEVIFETNLTTVTIVNIQIRK